MKNCALVVAALIGALGWAGQGTAAAITTSGRTCTIVGTAGNDRLVGTAGNDVICGLGGHDKIFGAGGNDWLAGGPGYDEFRGGAGADVFAGGPDPDTVFYDDHTTAVRVTLDGLANDGTGAEKDRLGGDIENVLGGRGADVIIGNSGPNVLGGEDGDDDIDGGAGADSLFGGRGFDAVLYDRRTNPVTVLLDNRSGDGESEEFDNVYNDFEVVVGGRGNDRLVGSPFGDVLLGEGGDDYLQGLAGPDALYGGPGHDTVTYAERTVPLTIRIDSIAEDGAVGEKDRVDVSVEQINGGRVNDLLEGSAEANVLRGGSGNDRLLGLGGDDRLYGEQGEDELLGGDGADVLFGGGSADTLTGEAGLDQLYGEDGDDQVEGGPDADVCQQVAGDTLTGCQGVTLYAGDGHGFVVWGTVLHADGTPVADQRLDMGYDVVTGADGSFAAVAGTRNSWELVFPLPNNRVYRLINEFPLTGHAQLTLTLPPLRTVTVRVHDEQGQPLQGAHLGFSDQYAPVSTHSLSPDLPAFTAIEQMTYLNRTTDATGHASFPTYVSDLGPMVVAYTAPVVGLVQSTAREVVPADGVLTRVLETRPSVLTADFSSPAGPIPGVDVTWHPYGPQQPTVSAVADAVGRVRMELARAQGSVYITTPAQPTVPRLSASSSLDMRAGDLDVALRLPAPDVTTVRVVDAAGNPLVGASVTGYAGLAPLAVPPLLLAGNQEFAVATTDAAGYASVYGYPITGIRVLRASWESAASGKHTTTSLALGSSLTMVVDIASVAVRGRVLDEDGAPVTGLGVAVDSDGVANVAVTDADGAWALRTSPGAGSMTLTASTYRLEGRVSLATDRQLILALPSMRQLTLRVVDGNGAPVAGASVTTCAPCGSAARVDVPGFGQLTGTQLPRGVTDASGVVRLLVWPGFLDRVDVDVSGRRAVLGRIEVGTADLSRTVVI